MGEQAQPEGLSYENIKITLDDKELNRSNLRNFKMIQQLNDHARVFFSGMVGEDQLIKSAGEETMIQVDYVIKAIAIRGEPTQELITPLFKGVVTNTKVTMAGRELNYEIEGASYTYLMDTKLEKRSFQDVNMTYQALVDQIAKTYSGVGSINQSFEKKNLGKFTIEFQETDWEFLKRIASREYEALVPNAVSNKVNFSIGVTVGTDQGKLSDLTYVMDKQISDYRTAMNYRKKVDEIDFIGYDVRMIKFKYMNLGDLVMFQGTELYVARVELVLVTDKSLFYIQYRFVKKFGLKQNERHNSKIVGAALPGKVIEVKQDRIKVKLDIDKNQKQEAAKSFLFPYSTPYTAEDHTGWYCMPEVGDTVNLYFPTNKEEEGVVIYSYRKEANKNDQINSPGVKIFRTKFGKELKFNDKEILITGKDGKILIRLNEDTGIEILSNIKVNIDAVRELELHSDAMVKVVAGTGLELACKESSISMNGLTHFKGKRIKTN